MFLSDMMKEKNNRYLPTSGFGTNTVSSANSSKRFASFIMASFYKISQIITKTIFL